MLLLQTQGHCSFSEQRKAEIGKWNWPVYTDTREQDPISPTDYCEILGDGFNKKYLQAFQQYYMGLI